MERSQPIAMLDAVFERLCCGWLSAQPRSGATIQPQDNITIVRHFFIDFSGR
jgi:hypothetical protein